MRYTQAEETKISECIGESFYDAFGHVMEHDYTYYNLVGGRGSLKSSFISIAIPLIMMQYPELHAVAYRKTGNTLRTSVYDQFVGAIGEKLNVGHLGHPTIEPMELEYKPTGQKIMFKGLDDPRKSKSIKAKFGYFGLLGFEELDEYDGEEEIRKVQQSVLRGGDRFGVFKSMNPPVSNVNWANNYVDDNMVRDDTFTSKTTYLTAPEEWLGQPFIDEAEGLKKTNPTAYRHEYLGEITGTGAEVFNNLEFVEFTDEEIEAFDHVYMGVDGGWYPDPFRGNAMNYDANRGILSLFNELDATKTPNEIVARRLIEEKEVGDTIITCDSAEPKSVADFRAFGINARGAEKGPNSVKEGLKGLQSRAKIRIDPVRCPKAAKEFKLAEYEITRDGSILNTMPDKDNHSIDLTRYAMERVGKRRGN